MHSFFLKLKGSGYMKYIFLFLPFIAMLWVSSYNSNSPEFMGFPLFYWYQFLWVLISAGITAIVYLLEKKEEGH
jgi:hypothetical protein